MSVTDIWSGALAEDGAWVRGKVTGASVRLAVSESEDLSSPTYFGPSAPTAEGVASIAAIGLDGDTRYHYAFEVDGVIDTSKQGRFRTLPPVGEPANFTIAAAGCAGENADDPTYTSAPGVSNHPVFDDIVEHDPLFFVHMGDMHYANIGVASQTPYRQAFDAVLAQSRQAALYRQVPIVYTWDDHDFGPNNSDETDLGRDSACLTYRERVPHYTLPAGAGANPIYHSFQVGRVLFIVSDSRSDRNPNSQTDDASKTLLGAAQKAWFLNLIDTTTASFVVWCNATPWTVSGVDQDTWGEFSFERAEIAAAISAADLADRICILSADHHSLVIDDGSNNAWGGFPAFHFGALDATANIRGAPFSHGFSSGSGRYGLLEFKDYGDGLVITGTGFIRDIPWRRHRFYAPHDFTDAPLPVKIRSQGQLIEGESYIKLGGELVSSPVLPVR